MGIAVTRHAIHFNARYVCAYKALKCMARHGAMVSDLKDAPNESRLARAEKARHDRHRQPCVTCVPHQRAQNPEKQ